MQVEIEVKRVAMADRWPKSARHCCGSIGMVGVYCVGGDLGGGGGAWILVCMGRLPPDVDDSSVSSTRSRPWKASKENCPST